MNEGFNKNLRKKKIQALKDGHRTYSSEVVKRRKDEICDIIETYSITEGGINQARLSQLTGIDRWYLADLLDSLINEGKVKKEGGKRGLYLPVQDFLNNLLLDAESFGQDFLFKFLKPKEYQILTEEERFVTRFFEPKFKPADELEKIIFEFSNMIGAFVVYSIITSLNPGTYPDMTISTQVLKDATKQYVIKSVGQITPSLIDFFNDYIRKEIPDISDIPLLSDENMNLLRSAFENIYPLVGRNFAMNRANVIPYTLEDISIDYKKQLFKNYEKYKAQETCNHIFGKTVFLEPHNLFMRRCRKCGFIKGVRKDRKRVNKKIPIIKSLF